MRSAKGATGRLLVGYQVAAELSAWTYTNREEMAGSGWTVEAVVRSVDAFWVEHGGPMVLELDFGEKALRWASVRADLSENAVSLSGVESPEVT